MISISTHLHGDTDTLAWPVFNLTVQRHFAGEEGPQAAGSCWRPSITRMASEVQRRETVPRRDQNNETYKPRETSRHGRSESCVEPCFLLQSISLAALLTSRWGPSCQSPWLTRAPPPWAGRTATTRSSRSCPEAPEGLGRPSYRWHRGALALLHDPPTRTPVGPTDQVDQGPPALL